jgi:hypothetical protein
MLKTIQYSTFLLFSILFLSACESTRSSQNAPLLVGPEFVQANDKPAEKRYTHQSDIFLDVAIPVFDPGFPIDNNTGEVDYEELGELDIWPQLRRTEAKRFAIQTKKALEKTKAFGSISNLPDANTTADLFVLGKINHSDSELVELEVTVVDSSGEIWGKKSFEHTVSQFFFRDQMNEDKNPYQPVFNQVADYVYSLATEMSDEERQVIKNTTLMRYAQYYSPQEFSQYLSASIQKKDGQRYYKFDVTGMPAEGDKMMSRIDTLRNQDLLFVDNLQNQFEAFEQETEVPYRTWQEEMLPELARMRAVRKERNTKVALGVLAGIATAVLAKNSGSTAGEIGTVVGSIASAWSLKDAFDLNASLRVHKAVIEEMGQGIDIDLSPTVMEFEDETIELQGTAREQYQQWKAHLREIYALESTPDVDL